MVSNAPTTTGIVVCVPGMRDWHIVIPKDAPISDVVYNGEAATLRRNFCVSKGVALTTCMR
eukprot:6649673-Ditylum_brightwellii.AAC.1